MTAIVTGINRLRAVQPRPSDFGHEGLDSFSLSEFHFVKKSD